MNRKKYKQLRVIVISFVAVMVVLSILRDIYLLSAASILAGIVFMILVKAKAKIRTDERESTVQEKAARMTYLIFTPTIGIAAFLLLLPSKGGIEAFSKGEWLFTESLGMVFAYLTLFLIVIYAISYHFFNRKFGGGDNEE